MINYQENESNPRKEKKFNWNPMQEDSRRIEKKPW
jgi:hypothetical protein